MKELFYRSFGSVFTLSIVSIPSLFMIGCDCFYSEEAPYQRHEITTFVTYMDGSKDTIIFEGYARSNVEEPKLTFHDHHNFEASIGKCLHIEGLPDKQNTCEVRYYKVLSRRVFDAEKVEQKNNEDR